MANKWWIKVSHNLSLRHAYFQAMLIFKYHSFWKRLFSSHAYFQVRAYFRENTVYKKSKRLTFSVPKQIFGASNIQSIQTQLCFDLFFRKQIFIIVCIICPAKDDSLHLKFVLGPKKLISLIFHIISVL